MIFKKLNFGKSDAKARSLRLEALESRELLAVYGPMPMGSNPLFTYSEQRAAVQDEVEPIELGADAFQPTTVISEELTDLVLPIASNETNSEIAATVTTDFAVSDDIYSNAETNASNDYVVIFSGGADAQNNACRYYDTLKLFYQELVDAYHIPAKNIYMLYADGDLTNTSVNRVGSDGNLTTSDMSYATSLGTTVMAATYENMSLTFKNVASKMDANSHLLYYAYDHGWGKGGAVNDYRDGVNGWGVRITSEQVRDAIYQVQQGYVTLALGHCYAGGTLDDFFNPETGEQIVSYKDASGTARVYTGSAHFAGCASTNHYEPSWTGTRGKGSYYVGYIQSFASALLYESVTTDVFELATAENEYTSEEEYNNNEGTYIDDYVWEHPWYAGESFSVFNSTTSFLTDDYEPNNSRYTATEVEEIAPGTTATFDDLYMEPFAAQDWFVVDIPEYIVKGDYICVTPSTEDVEYYFSYVNLQDGRTHSTSTLTGTRYFTVDPSLYDQIYITVKSAVDVDESFAYELSTTFILGSSDQMIATPSNLRADVDENSVELSWSGVEHATSYVLAYKAASDEEWTTQSVNTLSATLSNLESGIYQFKVRAITTESGYRSSAYSAPVYFNVNSAPIAPSNVTFGEYDAENSTLPINWQSNSDNELGFRVEYSTDGGTNWYLVGETEAGVTTILFENVDWGTYDIRVCAFNEKGDSNWATATAYIDVAPNAPSDIVFGEYQASDKSVLMSWTSNSDNESGFRVEISTDNESWTLAGTTAAKVTEFKLRGLRSGEYFVRVRAENPIGVSAWVSRSLTVETAPDAPSDVAFGEYVPSNKSIEVSWKDNSANETRFRVQYSTDGKNWVFAGLAPADATSKIIVGLESGTYTVRVRAENPVGDSAWATGVVTIDSAPAAPSDITFGKYDEQGKTLPVSWTSNSDNEELFRVEYRVEGGTWQEVGTTAAGVTTITVSNIELGTYDFRVRAENKIGASEWTEETVVVKGELDAPTDLTIGTFDPKARSVEISWEDNSSTETGFRVEVMSDGKTWKFVETTGPNVTSSTLTGLLAGSYSVRVRAENSATGGYSAWTTTSFTLDNLPLAPTRLLFDYFEQTEDEIGNLAVSWMDNSQNETLFRVEYSQNGKEWTTVATQGADEAHCKIEGLTAGKHYVRVRSENSTGASNWTTRSFTVEAIPTAPTALNIGDFDEEARTLTLNWDALPEESGATSLALQYSVDGKEWTIEQMLPTDATTATTAPLTSGATYVFRLASVNGNVFSTWANSDSYEPTKDVDAPTDVNVAFDEAKGVAILNWSNDAENVDSFSIESTVDGGETWNAFAKVAADQRSYAILVVADQVYQYRVKALRGTDSSEYAESNELDTALTAPTTANATYDRATRKATITWDDATDFETGYRVEYSVDGENWFYAVKVGKNETSATTYHCRQSGANYQYRVCATSGPCASEWTTSEALNVTVAAPTDVEVSFDDATQKATVTWTNNEANATGFRLEYTSDGGKTWYVYANLNAGATSKEVVGIRANAQYQYRVRALVERDSSAWAFSNVLDTKLNAPTDLDVVYTAGANSASLTWTDTNLYESDYRVDYSLDAGKTWNFATRVGRNATTADVQYLPKSASYTFRVAAMRSSVYSDWTISESVPKAEESNAVRNAAFEAFGPEWLDNGAEEEETMTWLPWIF